MGFHFFKESRARIIICEILLGLLGAIIDVSMSISSSMCEIHLNNSKMTKLALFKSGISIGNDILGTMTNTLLFAYISGFMTLIIWFRLLDYSFETIINAKVFVQKFSKFYQVALELF